MADTRPDDIIGMLSFAVSQCRSKFATLAGKHNKDEAADAVARVILAHLKKCGFDVVRVRPPAEAPTTHPKPKP